MTDNAQSPAASATMIRCPDSPLDPDGTEHTIFGCGRMIPDERDDEGIIDCPECGMWFNPDKEA